MHRTAHLIFNPVSGQGNAQRDLECILAQLSPELDLSVHETTPDCDARTLGRRSVEQGVDLVVVSGGDGTINAVAEALTQSSIPLAIIPRGTANAIATALDIPSNLDDACKVALTGTVRAIDTARCNGHPMVLLAGIGLEAAVIDQVSRQAKDRLGTLAYVFSGIQQLRELDSFEATIETSDRIITVNASAITIANIAPSTSVLAQGPAQIIADDGLLDITIVASEGIGRTLAASYELFRSAISNQAAQRDDVGYLRSSQVKITTNPQQKVVLDGEMMGTTPLEVSCVPQGLTLVVPEQPILSKSEDLTGLPNINIEPKP